MATCLTDDHCTEFPLEFTDKCSTFVNAISPNKYICILLMYSFAPKHPLDVFCLRSWTQCLPQQSDLIVDTNLLVRYFRRCYSNYIIQRRLLPNYLENLSLMVQSMEILKLIEYVSILDWRTITLRGFLKGNPLLVH